MWLCHFVKILYVKDGLNIYQNLIFECSNFNVLTSFQSYCINYLQYLRTVYRAWLAFILSIIFHYIQSICLMYFRTHARFWNFAKWTSWNIRLWQRAIRVSDKLSHLCEYEKKPEFSVSRHQSSKVVKLLEELTKVSRVSRSLESESFVFLERSHATVPKFAIHRGWNIRDVLRSIWERASAIDSYYRFEITRGIIDLAWEKLFRLHVKDYNRSRTFWSAWRIPAVARHCVPSEADFRPDGRDEWYIRYHFSFRTTLFHTAARHHLSESSYKKNIYAKSAPTTSERSLEERGYRNECCSLQEVRFAFRKISNITILCFDKISFSNSRIKQF